MVAGSNTVPFVQSEACRARQRAAAGSQTGVPGVRPQSALLRHTTHEPSCGPSPAQYGVAPEQSEAEQARQANSLPASCLQNGAAADAQRFSPSGAAGAHAFVHAPVPTSARVSQYPEPHSASFRQASHCGSPLFERRQIGLVPPQFRGSSGVSKLQPKQPSVPLQT